MKIHLTLVLCFLCLLVMVRVNMASPYDSLPPVDNQSHVFTPFMQDSSRQLSRFLEKSRAEAREQQTLLDRQRYFTVLAGIITLLMAVLAAVNYRSFKREKKLNQNIAEQKEEIRIQAEELAVSNAMLIRLNNEIAEQKEEITQINQQQEETIQLRTAELTQAYKELDTFFYRASHDFRRPVTTFLGLVQVARITVQDPPVLELFERVQQTAHHLDRMLVKLQSISDVGLQRLQFTEIDVHDLLHGVFKTFKDELTNAQIDFRVTVGVTSFYSYPSLVTVILGNLIENSINFRRPDRPYIHLRVYRQADDIVLEVGDNGQGIHPRYHEGIFDMYFRSNENSKGNGLGLYIVKKAVQKLHGTITFTSVLYEGSVFYAKLPDLPPAEEVQAR
ncbi:sensor histidine kinase [Dawidia soli]|uniref:histidine kinase n=1 Tax=Dawidia soli TaxID=2782352 RepID=A0AAP2DE41_9BACT|nr:HAMP domain-containing sensor histidine kinase [Dawidia soli]MBT1689979.1 HAMP domain-containing histidine kinase [Dawidia soli]